MTVMYMGSQILKCEKFTEDSSVLKTPLKYPVGKTIDALKKYICIPLDANNYQFAYYDEVLEACQKVFGIELDNKYRTRLQIQRLLRY